MNKVIPISCKTELTIPIEELNGIQGALKMMSKENFVKLRARILKKGVRFALHVWQERTKSKGKPVSKWWIIDGHGRHAVLRHLATEEGYTVGPLPCVEIQAHSFKEAKEEVLAASSSYQTTTKEGLYEFMTDLGLGVDALEQFDLPHIDLPEFKMEFYDSKEAEGTETDEKKKVEFDAYQNAAIKQIVLYFAKEDYEKVIARLDQLMVENALEDYSQVVWRLLGENGKS